MQLRTRSGDTAQIPGEAVTELRNALQGALILPDDSRVRCRAAPMEQAMGGSLKSSAAMTRIICSGITRTFGIRAISARPCSARPGPYPHTFAVGGCRLHPGSLFRLLRRSGMAF